MKTDQSLEGFTFPARRQLSRRMRPFASGRGLGSLLSWLLIAVVAVGWFLMLRPQALGGSAGYVMVRGASMQPTYHSGDLVVVRRATSYAIGDIVAYRVPAGDVGAGLTVIHRIVGGNESSGFVTRGDDNATPDDWRPSGRDIVGRAWFVLHHAGTALGFLHDPLALASLGAGVTVALILNRQPKKRRTPEPPRGAVS
jgi:signal peptidase I